jgi:hypothetical protein
MSIVDALAAIEYQRKQAGSAYATGIYDWGKQRQFALPKAAAGFGSRGLMNSGITRRGLSNVQAQTQRGLANLRTGFDDVIYDLIGQQVGHEKALASSQVQKALEGWAADADQIAQRNLMANQIRQATQ